MWKGYPLNVTLTGGCHSRSTSTVIRPEWPLSPDRTNRKSRIQRPSNSSRGMLKIFGIHDIDEAYSLRQTPVSQAIYFVHHDPTIFPEPEKFDPERWIRASNDGTNLKKYMVSFNKGSRQCLGMKYVPIIWKYHRSLLTLY